jgi:hypothetical protein
MLPLHESTHDDQQIVGYLLGLLPDEETEQLDEMSIAHDEVAWRLRVVENDLVDAYVGGTLAGETRERFESFYLSSPRRRQKVRFAGTFLRTVDRAGAPADTDAGRDRLRGSVAERDRPASQGSWAELRMVPRSKAAWTLAAAAVLLVLASAVLVQDARVRSGLDEVRRASAALDRRAQELEQQLKDQQAANVETVKELERLRESLAALPQRSPAAGPSDPAGSQRRTLMTALVLLPQTRSIGSIPTLRVPQGADRATFELPLESNEFSGYQVVLKDPATNQSVWRSGRITPKSPGGQPVVSVIVPTNVLKPQHYSLELTAYVAAGGGQTVGNYTFQIVRP